MWDFARCQEERSLTGNVFLTTFINYKNSVSPSWCDGMLKQHNFLVSLITVFFQLHICSFIILFVQISCGTTSYLLVSIAITEKSSPIYTAAGFFTLISYITCTYLFYAWINLRIPIYGLNSGRPWLGCEKCWLAPYKILTGFRCISSLFFKLILHDRSAKYCHWLILLCYFIGPSLGGKDNLVKLWDAKSGRELCSLWVTIFWWNS